MNDYLANPITLKENSMTEKRAYGMNNVLVVIDLGNGEVKAKVRIGNSTSWEKVSFPSVVAENFDGGFTVDGRKVVVGDYASQLCCSHTGEDASGKVRNALPLLMQVLKQSVGFNNPLKVNVIFGCPSVKDYGSDIKAALQGRHKVFVEGDAVSLRDEIEQDVLVTIVVPQLEGYLAYRMIKAKPSQVRYIVDIGNRTVILTGVNDKGGIVSQDHRLQVDDCGVQSMSTKMSKNEALTKLPHVPRIPTPQAVINYLLDTEFSDEEAKEVFERIGPYVGDCLKRPVDWVSKRIGPKDSVTLIGGGARIPGVASLFPNNAKVLKDSSWATVNGLCTIADELIGRAK